MTCCLCYLIPNIKLLIPIIAFFFICPCSESTLLPHVTPTAPALLLRLENSPALSFIYHCSQPNKIGSRGEWEGESLGDETGWLYLNQQQTLKSYTELVFSRSSLTRVIRVNTVKKGWGVGEICLSVFWLEVQGFKDSCELNTPGKTWWDKHEQNQYKLNSSFCFGSAVKGLLTNAHSTISSVSLLSNVTLITWKVCFSHILTADCVGEQGFVLKCVNIF